VREVEWTHQVLVSPPAVGIQRGEGSVACLLSAVRWYSRPDDAALGSPCGRLSWALPIIPPGSLAAFQPLSTAS
jgi:hypothetical protein